MNVCLSCASTVRSWRWKCCLVWLAFFQLWYLEVILTRCLTIMVIYLDIIYNVLFVTCS